MLHINYYRLQSFTILSYGSRWDKGTTTLSAGAPIAIAQTDCSPSGILKTVDNSDHTLSFIRGL